MIKTLTNKPDLIFFHTFRYVARVVICLVFFINFSNIVYADNDLRITYIVSDERDIYQQFIHKNIHKKASILNVDHLSAESLDSLKTDLFITLGSKATRKALASSNSKKVLDLFITRKSYQEILKKNNRKKRRKFSAIFIDQPVSRQLKLIKSAFPDKKHIGVAVSSESRTHIPELVKAGGELGLRIHIETLPDPDSIHHIIRKLAENNDLILALQDSNIYNKYTIQNILMTTYHTGIPVIGYSRPYVKAGSLMTIYTSVDNIATRANEIIKNIKKGKSLPNPDYCKYYSIELNHQVARSLGIILDNKSTLTDKIKKIEKEYPDE